jgi:hypothetical protein
MVDRGGRCKSCKLHEIFGCGECEVLTTSVGRKSR